MAAVTGQGLERVPFHIAISSPKLLKPRWDTLSGPQKTILKAFYGLPLTDEELVWWSITQGGATYDEYGFVKHVDLIPYQPKEYSRLVAVLGRRSGKSDAIVSTAVAYEVTLGGHKRFVKPDQEYRALTFAQTKEDAQRNLQFIRMALEESPLLAKQVKEVLATEIRMVDGLNIEPAAISKAVGRGHAIPVVVLDEASFYYTDPNAATPDYEVLRAVSYAQLQFPHAKIFIPSTPWSEQGIVWSAFKAGTEGRKLQCAECKRLNTVCPHFLSSREKFADTLVVHASTAAMENPLITRKRLVELHRDDPEAFPRESLAQFIKTVSGWLHPERVDAAISAGVTQRGKEPNHIYIAAIDPAFRKDSFAFTILHHDLKKGLVQDFIQYWEPAPHQPLKPGEVLDDIKTILDAYGISEVYSDQYQLESLQQLALDRGFVINGFDFTGKSKGQACGSFKFVLDQQRMSLLEHEKQAEQLKTLQRRVLQTGNVQIAAPPGKHDDLAMVLILASRILVWLIGEQPKAEDRPKDVDTDHHAMVLAQIERKKAQASLADND